MEEASAQGEPQVKLNESYYLSDANTSVSTDSEGEGAGANVKVAVPKENIAKTIKRRGSLSKSILHSLGFSRKKDGQEEKGDRVILKANKKLKQKSTPQLKKYEKLEDSPSSAVDNDTFPDTELSQPPRDVPLSEGQFPSKFTRESSKSKIASTFVRRTSFGNFKKEKTLDKKMKQKSAPQLKRYEKLENSPSSAVDNDTTPDTELSQPSRDVSTVPLSEGQFPSKLKRESSKSKLAATFVRKISFGKLRKETSLDKFLKTKVMPIIKSSTSSSDDMSPCSESLRTPPGADLTDSENLTESRQTTLDTVQNGSIEQVNNTSRPSVEAAHVTTTNLQQSIINNNIIDQSDKQQITILDLPSQTPAILRTHSQYTQFSDNPLIQSEVTFVAKGGGESGLVFQNTDNNVSQLGASGDLKTTGNAFEREPRFQIPSETRGVGLESVEKPPGSVVSELLVDEKPDTSVVAASHAVGSTAYNSPTFNTGIDIAVASRSNTDTEEYSLSSPELSPRTSRAEITSKIRSSWMSKTLNDEADAALPQQLANVTLNDATKSRKNLSITTAIIEENRSEAREEPGNLGVAPDSAPSNDKTESPGPMLESVPGSSKSESFFTPRDSPSAMSSLDTDSSSQESHFFNPEATVETPEQVYSSPTTDTSLSNGEDVMAAARARLSHSLGIANTTATQNQVGDKREHLYKILVIGELGTGKTSIIKRYVHQFFSQHYRATIGVDFALKVLNWDANTIIRLQLWDIAGQERFGNMTRVYYKEAVGAFIVFDVTRAATFDAVVKWKQDLDSKVQLPDGSSIPCVLLANKCDQQKEGLVNQPAKMDEYCKERGFSGWFETSAKENINIEEAARALVSKILQNDQLRIQSDSVKDGEKFNLEGNNLHDEKAKGKCSC